MNHGMTGIRHLMLGRRLETQDGLFGFVVLDDKVISRKRTRDQVALRIGDHDVKYDELAGTCITDLPDWDAGGAGACERGAAAIVTANVKTAKLNIDIQNSTHRGEEGYSLVAHFASETGGRQQLKR
ncbi:MAG TPA: hypothetical protein VIJ38_06730 [Acidobacteriaceae bacterium]